MPGMSNQIFWLQAAEAFPAQIFSVLLTTWINSRRERRDRNAKHDRAADLKRDLAVERAKREAAEQLTADRAEHITDLRRSLLTLEAGRPAQPPERSLTLVPDAHAPEPLRATGGQAWWRRRGHQPIPDRYGRASLTRRVPADWIGAAPGKGATRRVRKHRTGPRSNGSVGSA